MRPQHINGFRVHGRFSRSIPAMMALFLLFLSVHLSAQMNQEQLKQMRSNEISTIDGKDYYIHTIKRGQTLYMISKIYSVDVNAIISENPEVKEGIKAEQKIRIPAPGKSRQTAPPPPAPPVKTKDTSKPVKPVVNKKSADSLLTASPKPGGQTKKADTLIAAASKPVDSVVVVKDLPCGIDSSTKKAVYSVALMLPLYLDESEQLNTENPARKVVEESKSLQFIAFYEGVRMALDTLEKSGLRLKLYVYDVDKDTVKTRKLLMKPELKSMDLIIGLLYHRNFQIVADFAGKQQIPIVNPISERSDILKDNPFVFKAIPSNSSQLEQLAGFLADQFPKNNILIIRSGQYADRDIAERLSKACMARKLAVQVVDGQEGAINKLSKEKDNFLVVFSDNAAYVHDLTRRFFQLRGEYRITIAGLPDWGSMEGLELEYLISLKTHLIARQFIDYENSHVKSFVTKYQERYKTDPPVLAFQGYDIASFFFSALKQFGSNFSRCFPEFNIDLLQTRYEFRQDKGEGFENQHWMIYKYENYRLVPVNGSYSAKPISN